MAGEKYIVATSGNPLQIEIRNMLNPYGFVFMGNCRDSVSLMRMVRGLNPDFLVAELGMQPAELKRAIDTIDEEMLCACVMVGDYKDLEAMNLMQKSRVVSFCPRPLNKEMLRQTAEMSVMGFKRVREMDKKLREVSENFETRKIVEKAKWILIEKYKITENEAYEKIRKRSMDSRLSIRIVADAIIKSAELDEK